MHELWWTTGAVGHGDLSGDLANAPLAQSNPTAYFVAADQTNHVIYQYLGYLHELWWKEGSTTATHNNLTAFAGAPLAEGDPSAYFVAANGTHHVIYRSQDGHLHELQWSN